MNQTQFMATLRHLITLVCGYFVGRGWVSENTAMFIVSLVLAMGPMIWTIIETTKTNLVAKVKDMPEVAAVITTATVEGAKLAAAIPGPVLTAGTPQAVAMAKDGEK